MQAANLRNRSDLATVRRLDETRVGRSPIQRPMGSGIMVISHVAAQHPSQMGFAENDHVVQTLAANASDQAFSERILPGRLRGDEHFLYAHAGEATPEALKP